MFGAVILAMHVALADRQGLARDRLSGATPDGILKAFIARGTDIFPPRPAVKAYAQVY